MSLSPYPVPAPLQPFLTSHPLVVRSPGRINIIGEHTDYNEGFVLPAAIDKAVYVALAPRTDQRIELHSLDFSEKISLEISDRAPRPGHWSTYILGVVDQLIRAGTNPAGFSLVIFGDVPLGAGLSSSAAVECAVAFGLNELWYAGLDRRGLALLAQAAEHDYAGVKCGIMDQFASLFGKKEQVIRLDCRSLEYQYFPLQLNDYVLVLLDTQVKHSLASSAYNERRAQCEAGVALIQRHDPEVKSLRDASPDLVKASIPGDHPSFPRCLYVVEENERLLRACRALEAGDIPALGQLMLATHAGLRDQYEVSCAELDYLVEKATEHPGVAGARMMGGGFGGCTINLVRRDAVEQLLPLLQEAYRRDWHHELPAYIVKIEDGSSVIHRAAQ
jgi:galactokinase